AYRWLVRRREGRGHWEWADRDVFGEYLAHVNRLVGALHRAKAAISRPPPESGRDETPRVEEAPPIDGYKAKGGAIGSAAWVERLCQPGGLLGFLRQRTPQALETDSGTPAYAAKRSHSGD
ncbi:MAG: hypothetical protein JJT96_16760, partial [Opitutales bacterium]|nr:hypothetical protein [Opitutales bacterium]